MIPYDKYIGEFVVLITNAFTNPEDISGIRKSNSRVFKFKGKYVLARPLTIEDLKDEDFVDWLNSMWGHKETNIKTFIKNRCKSEQTTHPTSPLQSKEKG